VKRWLPRLLNDSHSANRQRACRITATAIMWDETKTQRVHFQGVQNGSRYGNNVISKTKERCTVVRTDFNIESLDQIRIHSVSWIRLCVDLQFGKSQGLPQLADEGSLRGHDYELVKEITPVSCELIQMIELKVCRLLLPVSKMSCYDNQDCTFSSLVTC
jgi:hypothetical protein